MTVIDLSNKDYYYEDWANKRTPQGQSVDVIG